MQFGGDRSDVSGDVSLDATSVTGGPSARLLASTADILTIRLKTESTAARKAYSAAHAQVPFAAEQQYTGFYLTHRCIPPAAAINGGFAFLGAQPGWAALCCC